MTLADKRQKQLKKEGQEVEAPPELESAPTMELAKMPETDEVCSSCDSPLKWVPINSRVRALVCTKIGCNLYRQRIRLYSEPRPTMILPEGQYWCNKCGRTHMEESGIGQKHIAWKK